MPNLLLIPTSLEAEIVEQHLYDRLHSLGCLNAWRQAWKIELCGFGLVSAAAQTAFAIRRQIPQTAMLVGIAGSLDDSMQIGSACEFDRVSCHGIGVGNSFSYHHQSSGALGWAQVETNESHAAVDDTIMLAKSSTASATGNLDPASGSLLVSVTTASADDAEANERRRRFPGAMAEDMEGFAVALACQIAKVPLTIVRGISNRAGERNHFHWQVEAALHAATNLAVEMMRKDKRSQP